MPSVKDPNNGKSQHNTESAMSAGAMEQVKDFYTQRAAKIKKLYAADQYETATIHGIRVKSIELQFTQFEAHKREVMLSRDLDVMAEYCHLADKRYAIEAELRLAHREYQEQMAELAQRLDASLTGLAEEAKQAGIDCNFKEDSTTG